MEIKPIWYNYAIWDDDCNITGLSNNAPKEAKDAYDEYVSEQREYMDRRQRIPK